MSDSGGARRNPWPIGLTVVLGALVLLVIGFTAYTTTLRYDLVSASYYEDELRYQHEIDRERQALQAGAVPELALDAAGAVARLTFPAVAGEVEGGEIHLYRPDDAGLDRRLPMALDSGRGQDVELAGLSPGLWRLHLRWSSAGREYAARQTLVVP
jgi:hypothetical protein